MARLLAEAHKMGFFLKHQDSFLQEIGLRMATSLRTLGGQFLWQTASFTFRDCPREVLKDLPPSLKVIDQPLSLQMRADTMTDAAELARPFFALVPSVCGLTKLITKPSSPAAQQAATVTALTLTWEKPKARHRRPTLTVEISSRCRRSTGTSIRRRTRTGASWRWTRRRRRPGGA